MPATFDDLVDFQNNITKLYLSRKIRCMGFHPNQGGFFATYHGIEIRIKTVTIEGWKLIRFSTAITKRSFIYWLALKDRLSTRGGLVKWSYSRDFLFVNAEV